MILLFGIYLCLYVKIRKGKWVHRGRGASLNACLKISQKTVLYFLNKV